RKLIESQTQSNIAATQEKAKAKMMEIEAQMKSQIGIDTNLKELEAKNKEFEAGLKERLMMKEFEINMILKGQEQRIAGVKDREKEDRKDKRQDRQNTQQSKLMKQRETNGEPINFESNEDSLDGFNLSEFE